MIRAPSLATQLLMCVLKTSHRPDGKIADVLALTHACTTANASVNYSLYVPQRPSKVPIAPMGFSHVLRFVLAGRRCVHRRWHGELLIVRHHWQHSCGCACSCSKVPIAPMGKCLTLMGFSHASCFVLSGWRWCLCLWRHGDLLIVHHHWQHNISGI